VQSQIYTEVLLKPKLLMMRVANVMGLANTFTVTVLLVSATNATVEANRRRQHNATNKDQSWQLLLR
jgi:hypothetical protein